MSIVINLITKQELKVKKTVTSYKTRQYHINKAHIDGYNRYAIITIDGYNRYAIITIDGYNRYAIITIDGYNRYDIITIDGYNRYAIIITLMDTIDTL